MKKKGMKILWGTAALLLALQAGSFGVRAEEAAPMYARGKWENVKGAWKFSDEQGQAVTGWIRTASGWYYLNPADGIMRTGWHQAPTGTWYFLQNTKNSAEEGKMLSGWQWIDGYCYYFEEKAGAENGAMYAGKMTPDGFMTNAQGRWVDARGKEQYQKGKGFMTKAESKTKRNVSKSGSSGGGSGSGSGTQKPEEKPQTRKLADGEWYGTGTYSRYIASKGANVMKISIREGKIASTEVLKYTDDEGWKRGLKILEASIGLTDVSALLQQMESKSGSQYDMVSGATQTAKGHLSAVQNALARSEKFARDGKAQDIAYMEFAVRPAAVTTENTIDLSKTVLKLYFTNGESKEVPYGQLGDYQITVQPEHGSPIEDNAKLSVHFKQEDALLDIYTMIQKQAEFVKHYPTHILVKYEDGTEDRIPVDKENFHYDVEFKGKVQKIEIYDESRLLAEAVYQDRYSAWKMEIGHQALSDPKAVWAFKTYFVRGKIAKDHSSIESFALDTSFLKTNYREGDTLSLANLSIKAMTQKGNARYLSGWEDCKKAGFVADVAEDYVFSAGDAAAGTKEIRITHPAAGSQSFTVSVAELKSQTPARIEFWYKGKQVQTMDVREEDFAENGGYMVVRDLPLPSECKDGWKTEDFAVKAYNSENTLLQTETKIQGIILRLDFPNYKTKFGEKAYIMFGFKFE